MGKKTMGDIQKGLTTIIRLKNWMWYQLVQKKYRLVLEGIADKLVALALMIAESRTEEKDVMVKVVVNLINSNIKKRI